MIEIVERRLAAGVSLRRVMGGLAPDSDEPMPEAIRDRVQEAWHEVASATGARFDHRFWDQNAPRRSTWVACRACLVAEEQRVGAGAEMFRAIQEAYYLRARNPSLPEVLAELADSLGLEVSSFRTSLDSPAIQAALEVDFGLRDDLGASAFPSLGVLDRDEPCLLIRGWRPAEEVLSILERRHLVAPQAPNGD